MKKGEIIITTIIIFGLLLGFVFILIDKNPSQVQSNQNGIKSDPNLMMKRNILSISINNSSLNNNVKYLDSLCVVIPLNEIINKSAKLMIYIPEEACASCFKEELESLNDVIMNLGDSNVVNLFSGNNFREALVFQQANHLSSKMYFTKELLFNGTKYKTIMYGVIQPDLKIHDVYFPMKSYPEFSKMYIKAIKDKYFTKEQIKPKLDS